MFLPFTRQREGPPATKPHQSSHSERFEAVKNLYIHLREGFLSNLRTASPSASAVHTRENRPRQQGNANFSWPEQYLYSGNIISQTRGYTSKGPSLHDAPLLP